MAFRKHNPGCPCCDDCTIAEYAFSASAELSEFTQDAGTWTVSDGYLQTTSASALLIADAETTSVEQVITLKYLPEASGDSVTIRFGWDTTSGDYLWAKYTAGSEANGSGCGEIELGIYIDGTGSETLEGPWTVIDGEFGSEKELRVCYDGERATFRFRVGTTTKDIAIAFEPEGFTHPGGKTVGIETGQAATYKFDSLKIEDVGNGCPECDDCFEIDELFPRDYEASGTYYHSCRWTSKVAGWAQDQSADRIVSTTSGAVIQLEKEYVAWDQERAFRIEYDLTTSPDDVLKIYFWWVDANNHYYLQCTGGGGQVYQVVAGSATLLGSAPATSYGEFGSGPYVRDIYLIDGRISVSGIVWSGGTAAGSISEFFKPAPSSPSFIRFESATVQEDGEVAVERFRESCGTHNRGCNGCSDGSVFNGLPERVEIVVSGNTADNRINGTYIATLINQPDPWACRIIDSTDPICVWQVLNLPSGFSYMVFSSDWEAGSQALYFIANIPGVGGGRWVYADRLTSFPKCADFDGKQLNPNDPWYPLGISCPGTKTPTDGTGGTCYITALENET
jgi:hypothetical protein